MTRHKRKLLKLKRRRMARLLADPNVQAAQWLLTAWSDCRRAADRADMWRESTLTERLIGRAFADMACGRAPQR